MSIRVDFKINNAKSKGISDKNMTALNLKSNIHKILKPCNMCFNIYETWHCLPFVMYIEACSGWHSCQMF